MKKPLCKNEDCMNDCGISGHYNTFVLRIPFTKIEIHIVNFKKPIYDEYCYECRMDIIHSQERDKLQPNF